MAFALKSRLSQILLSCKLRAAKLQQVAQLSPCFSCSLSNAQIASLIFPSCASLVGSVSRRLIQISISIIIQREVQSQAKMQKLIKYRFPCQYSTAFGESIYLSGSIPQLGNWNRLSAIKLEYHQYKVWCAEVMIPLDTDIQFKYWIGGNSLQNSNIQKWIGDSNRWLRINSEHAQKFDASNSSQLKIMSFNVRFQNKNDKQKYSWGSRRQKCCSIISEYFPDIVGLQEPKVSQRVFMMQKLGYLYNYYGKPRDLKQDEQSGIMIRRDKYAVIQDGYVWINENKAQGKKGFGARLPRYFTFLVVAPYSQSNWFVIINTHLDHQSNIARLQGIKYITQKISELKNKYKQKIEDVFITGDYNTNDQDKIFQQLFFNSQKMSSMRRVLPYQHADLSSTFNGFSSLMQMFDYVRRICKMDSATTIDHIFIRTKYYRPISFRCIRKDEIISDHYPIIGTFSIQK